MSRATRPHHQHGLALAVALGILLGGGAAAHAHDLEPPRVVSSSPGEWPAGHLEHHDVVVPMVLVVREDGTVAEAKPEIAVGHGFDEAASRCALTWRFEPARRDGKPVSARIRAAVRFPGHTHQAAPDPAKATAHAEHTHVEHTHTGEPTKPSGVSAPVLPAADPKIVETSEAPERVRVSGRGAVRSASEVVRERDVLAAAPHKTASDLLNVVPGVFVTQHSGEGKAHQIFMRGFDAVHGQDVELSVGGVPVNDVSNVHGQGYADLHFVMPEVVREVRALPGPYDPSQGDFAVAGSVRMKLGLAEPGFMAKGTLGSFGTRRLLLAYHPKNTSEETFAAFEEYKTDGFGPSRSARRGNLLAQGTYDFGNDVSLRALVGVATGRFDAPGVLRARDVYAGRVDRFATPGDLESPFGAQGGSSSRTQVALDLHRDTESGGFRVAPFFILRSFSLRQNFTGYFVDPKLGDNSEQLNDAVTVGTHANYKRTLTLFAESDSIEAGLYARHDMIEQAQRRFPGAGGEATATLIDAKVRATNVAGYADVALHPLRRLVVRGGARVDALAFGTDDAATGALARRTAQGAHLGKKATLDYAPVAGLHLLASYGDGFRSPQARALSNGESAPFTTVTSFEGGARWTDGRRATVSAAVYYSSLSQDLVFDPESARNETAPGSRRLGVSVDATLRAGDWFTLAASSTYTRATFGEDGRIGTFDVRAGDLLPYVPQWVTRVDMNAKRPIARLWNRVLELRAGGALESLNRRPLPYGELGRDVFLVDTSLGLRFKEVELSLDVTNLLDARWFDGQFVFASNFDKNRPAGRIPQFHVTSGPPRAAFIHLSLTI